jgi:ketosteroid isomerase-like protein
MKKVTVLFISLVTIVYLVSTGFGFSFDNKNKKLEEFERISSNNLYMNLFNSGKIDSLALMYHENACVMVDDGLTLFGRKSINAHDMDLYNSGIRFTELQRQAKIVEGSVVVERGTWTIIIGTENLKLKGSYLVQWRYIDKKWGIENSMSKTDKVLPMDN